MTYFVYEIVLNGTRRYVGITNNIKRRQAEHRRDVNKSNLKKYFYKMIVDYDLSREIVLNRIYAFDNKTEAMRMEAKLILDDWFEERKLWQHPPYSFKYY